MCTHAAGSIAELRFVVIAGDIIAPIPVQLVARDSHVRISYICIRTIDAYTGLAHVSTYACNVRICVVVCDMRVIVYLLHYIVQQCCWLSQSGCEGNDTVSAFEPIEAKHNAMTVD